MIVRRRLARRRGVGEGAPRGADRGGSTRPRAGIALAIGVVALAVAGGAGAETPPQPPQPAPAQLAAIAMGQADDARAAIAIGFGGEVFAPASEAKRLGGAGSDGRSGAPGMGEWLRVPGIGVARTVGVATRGGGLVGVVIGADGAVFRLAEHDGWTAIRLAQKGRAIVGTGPRAVAALGREVFDLDRGAEPTRVAQLGAAVVALAGGPKGILARTERGATVRIEGKGALRAVSAPAEARLVGDRWAIANGAAIDVVANKRIAAPAIAAATELADGTLVAVTAGAKLELVTIAAGATKATRAAIPVDAPAAPSAPTAPGATVATGIVADSHDRIAIALRDGRIVVRDRGAWSTQLVRDDAPAAKPGSPPATSN